MLLLFVLCSTIIKHGLSRACVLFCFLGLFSVWFCLCVVIVVYVVLFGVCVCLLLRFKCFFDVCCFVGLGVCVLFFCIICFVFVVVC